MTDQMFMIWSGTAMLSFFTATLIARPLQKYTGIKQLMRYRKQLGWLTGTAAISHFGYWLVFYNKWSTDWWFLAGLIPFIVIMAMTATSNVWSIKKLGKNWKKLHKLTYIITPIMLYHVAFAIRGFNEDAILWGIPLLILVAWRYDVAWPTFLATGLVATFYYIGAGTNPVQTIIEEDIEFVCIKAHKDSVSCGWPIYFPDGTRIDNEDQLLEWMESHSS